MRQSSDGDPSPGLPSHSASDRLSPSARPARSRRNARARPVARALLRLRLVLVLCAASSGFAWLARAMPERFASLQLVVAAPPRPECALPASRALAGPQYGQALRRRIAWPSFPVRVGFVRDAAYSVRREAAARRGLERWREASGGALTFEVAEDVDEADVRVRFDATSNDGQTSTHYRGSRITGAEVRVGVERDWSSDIACIAAHEFGHALGIDGHSDDPRDLMYPTHTMGRRWSVTERDWNTLAALYPAQLGAIRAR